MATNNADKPIDETVVSIPFNAGIETDTNPQLPNGLLKLENASFDRAGLISKRWGITLDATLSEGRWLASSGQTALVYQPNMLAVSPSGTQVQMTPDATYHVTDVSTTRSDLSQQTYFLACDRATYIDSDVLISCVSYITYDGSTYSAFVDVFDDESGLLLNTHTIYSGKTTSYPVRLLQQAGVGNGNVLAFSVTTGGFKVDLINGPDGFLTNTINEGSAAYRGHANYLQTLDACTNHPLNVYNFWVTYVNAAGNLAIVEVTSLGAFYNITTVAPTLGGFISMAACCSKVANIADATNGECLVAWVETNGSSSWQLNSNTYDTAPASTGTIATKSLTSGWAIPPFPTHITCVGQGIAGTDYPQVLVTEWINASSYSVPDYITPKTTVYYVAASTFFISQSMENVCLASKAFFSQGEQYVIVRISTWFAEIPDSQNVFVMVRCGETTENGRVTPLAKMFAGGAAGVIPIQPFVAENDVKPVSVSTALPAFEHVTGTLTGTDTRTATQLRSCLPISTGLVTTKQETRPNVITFSANGTSGSFIFGTRTWLGQVGIYLNQNILIDTYPSAQPKAENLNDRTFIGGALPMIFSGSQFYENQFLMYGGVTRLTQSTTASGSLTLHGTYRYYTVLSFIDSNGRLTRSTQSIQESVITLTGTNNAVTLKMYVPYVSWRRAVAVEVYRTLESGLTAYRIGAAVLNPGGLPTSDGATTFLDEIIDTAAMFQPVLYIQLGELPNQPPESYTVSTMWRGRHVYVPAENSQTTVGYSKLQTPGFEIGYSGFLTITVESDGGEIVGVVPIVDKLLLLKESSLYAVEGDGYDNTGGGRDFEYPYQISQEVGCIDQRSIVRLKDQVLFLSRTGIWAVDTSIQLIPVGDRVRHWTDKWSRDLTLFGGAMIDPVEHRVMFMSASPDIPHLIYDWLRGQWLTSNPPEGDCQTIQACAKVGLRPMMLSTNGPKLLRQMTRIDFTPGAGYADDGDLFDLAVDTGWINLGAFGKFMRFYGALIIGYRESGQDLEIKVAYNYDPKWETYTSTYATELENFGYAAYFDMLGALDDQAIILDYKPPRVKFLSSIRMRITGIGDSAGAGPAAPGYSYTGLVLTLGDADTEAKVGPARQTP